jgi:hypothetical protein
MNSWLQSREWLDWSLWGGCLNISCPSNFWKSMMSMQQVKCHENIIWNHWNKTPCLEALQRLWTSRARGSDEASWLDIKADVQKVKNEARWLQGRAETLSWGWIKWLKVQLILPLYRCSIMPYLGTKIYGYQRVYQNCCFFLDKHLGLGTAAIFGWREGYWSSKWQDPNDRESQRLLGSCLNDSDHIMFICPRLNKWHS